MWEKGSGKKGREGLKGWNLGDGAPRAKLGREADGRRLGDGAARAGRGKGLKGGGSATERRGQNSERGGGWLGWTEAYTPRRRTILKAGLKTRLKTGLKLGAGG